MTTPHSVQMLDGSDVQLYIAKLTTPNRVVATRELVTGLLSFGKNPITGLLEAGNFEPQLYSGTGPTAGKLIEVSGAMDLNTTFGKTNKEYRLFNDDGWVQDKITGRNWQATMQGMYVRNTSTTAPDLEDSFKIIFENSLEKEEEVYVKFRKFLGIIPRNVVNGIEISPAFKRYLVEAGNVKVINFGDQGAADGILQISATLKGQGAFIYGFEEVGV